MQSGQHACQAHQKSFRQQRLTDGLIRSAKQYLRCCWCSLSANERCNL